MSPVWELVWKTFYDAMANVGVFALFASSGLSLGMWMGRKTARERDRRVAYLKGVEAVTAQLTERLRRHVPPQVAVSHAQERLADIAQSDPDAHVVLLSMVVSSERTKCTLSSTMGQSETLAALATIAHGAPDAEVVLAHPHGVLQ